ncbi:hypothetical protein [Rhizobium leguminosarum]|uniref:hypothetical protein n=1 Tax=Rhizobium leguminosarum TaxID=384 RepID=UPI003F9CDFFF
MSFSDFITIVGVIVTVISMAISIRQARSAFKSSQDAKNAMAAVQLAAVAERLKSAQEHIRDVAPDRFSQRGVKFADRLALIRREFDIALSALPKTGGGSDARMQLTDAQSELNIYQKSLPLMADAIAWQKLQVLVQDAISDLTSATSKVGEPK